MAGQLAGSRDIGGRLRAGAIAAYALPNFTLSTVLVPVTAFIPAIYAKTTLVNLGQIGVILMISRIFDALTDQYVGFLSDRTRSRWGPRKPWIAAAVVPLMIACYFLYNPPGTAGALYFAAFSLLFYWFYTMINIPYQAWGAEMSGDYDERNRVFTWQSISGQVGGMLVFMAPMILFYLGLSFTQEMGREFLTGICFVSLVLLPLFAGIAITRAPAGKRPDLPRTDFISILRSVSGNGLLLRFMAAYFIVGVGYGTFSALIFIFFDGYMGLGKELPMLFAMMAVVSIASLWPWMKIVNRFGKHRPWAVSWLLSALTLPLLLFVEPGREALWAVVVILALNAFCESVSNVVPFSMLADIIDYDVVKTRRDRAGSYYALLVVSLKIAAAIGAGAGFLILHYTGFDVKDPAANSALAKTGMLVAFIGMPSLFKLVSVVPIWSFPLDRRRHRIVRRRIEQLAARRARTEADVPEAVR